MCYQRCFSDFFQDDEYKDHTAEHFSDTPFNPAASSVNESSGSSTSGVRSHGSFRKRQARSTDDKLMDIMTKAEKQLESINADDSFDRYGKHIADRLRQVSPQQIKFVQKLIGDVLFEAEMESLNKNFRIVDVGENKEIHFRSPTSHYEKQPTYPPPYKPFQYRQHDVPQPCLPQQTQAEALFQHGFHATDTFRQTPQQLETERALPTPPAGDSSLTRFINNFSNQNV